MPVDEAKSNGGSAYQPTIRDLIQLDAPRGVKVSPNGSRVAVMVRTTNWKENRYDTLCYVHTLADGSAYPLNRSGNVLQVEWVDDNTLALLKRENGGDNAKAQIWLYEGLTGEGWAVTDHKSGVDSFKPFADGLLFQAKNPERDERKSRADRFGKYTHFEQEESASALYYVGVAEMREYQARVKAATEAEAKEWVKPVAELSLLLDEAQSIRGILPSPAGDAIYLNCWKRDDLVYRLDTRSYRIALNVKDALAQQVAREQAKKAQKTEDAQGSVKSPEPQTDTQAKQEYAHLGTITQLHLPRGATIEAVSPDGSKLLINHRGRDDKMYTKADLWVLAVEAALNAADTNSTLSRMRNITTALDRDLMEVYWVAGGIFATYVEGTAMRLASFDEVGQVTLVEFSGVLPQSTTDLALFTYHVCNTGRLALIGGSNESYIEVHVAEPAGEGNGWSLKRLTNYAQAYAGWEVGTVETIKWKSKDGAEIEGVLRKPKDFDPTHKYPLVFVVHGGPHWYSHSFLLFGEDMAYYPSAQFVNQGMLVLKPNYRGSTGYGQAFAELNVNNLGVGDLWDLESAVDHLVALGWVDPERVGCMGWSQGGYISAFAGLHSDKFKAVSVGAGISDWYTYHISNDIPDFTVDYLSGSPFRDRELYVKTAPISNIANAHTPMLIQHGSDDRRVPVSNAHELYRGLKELGVPVELFIFPGMGHPITKPRENHAVMYQNLNWFSHYLLGEELKLE